MRPAPEARPQAEEQPPAPPRRKKRRGVTSMEYVVMASFILLVVIAAVQSFGFSVGKLFGADAAATATQKPPK
jgi:Flp pilus assembly pilin Flp